MQSAGWLEGGLIAGYEKFILDLEVCAMIARYSNGVTLSEDDFAWDAYKETPSGQHFLRSAHTMRHYKTAFHQHQVFSMDNYEKWAEEGHEDSYKKANKIWKKMLRAYDPPPMDPAVREELDEYVALRRSEIESGKPRSKWNKQATIFLSILESENERGKIPVHLVCKCSPGKILYYLLNRMCIVAHTLKSYSQNIYSIYP